MGKERGVSWRFKGREGIVYMGGCYVELPSRGRDFIMSMITLLKNGDVHRVRESKA